MKERFIEWLRAFLRKTVLPIRRRREKFYSKLRFSISLRVGLNYLRFFIIYGILFILLFIALFIFVESREKFHMAAVYVKEIKTNGFDGSKKAEEYFKGVGITFQVRDSENNVVESDTGLEKNRKYMFSVVSYTFEEGSLVLHRAEKVKTPDGKNLIFDFYINMDSTEKQIRHMLIPMILLMVIMITLVIKSGSTQTEQIMEPINIMSRTADRLTAGSLNKERLNIEGTQNELKDLAETINRMLDRLDNSYESQKQFVSDASHELRTPIAVIQGYINMLDRWGKNDEAVRDEAIEAIKNESVSMQELVEKLLFLSRHDKKTMKLKKEFFEMSEVVDEMIKETGLVTPERNICTEAIEKVMVFGDKQSLKQAIRVLIDNAIKYSKKGDSICISCRNKEGDCCISVEDTGIGMSQKDLDHVFERFYRSDNVRNEKINGHGLGLSIAKLIIMKHSGTIKVRSQVGVGTEFLITIPKFKLW